MKVSFSLDINKEDVDPGKHKFFIRLSKEMKKRGVEVNNENSDIHLHLSGQKRNPKSKLNVLRLDNVVLDIGYDRKNRNKIIVKDIEKSDAIIYQSNFGKELHNKFLGVKDNKKYKIIPNGVSPEEFLPRSPKNYFLANCKWRPCKRLSNIIESYLLALKNGLDSDLVITGKSKFKIDHKRIKFLPWQNSEQIKILLSGAISTLHFSWLDCCPNSMIESIVAGCPVIYTKSGGQIELGKDSGIGIKDGDWDFRPCDLDSSPQINIEEASLAMIKMKKEKMEIKERKDLDIKNVCDQYLKFFEEVL